MKTKISVCFILILFLTLPTIGQAQENQAKVILKAMSDYVGKCQTLALSFDSDIEIITPRLEKIQFTSSGEALLSRPDKLRARRIGGYAEVEMFFDGKSVNIYGRHINGYARFDAPGSVDQLIHALRQGHGVALPGADLLLENSYGLLVQGIQEAKDMGQGVIDGVECEHLAFRNADTDWQLWVETGKNPIPRKLVITSKTINCAPQYTLRIKSWETAVEIPQGAFTFTPPKGATILAPDALLELDELPPEASEGGPK